MIHIVRKPSSGDGRGSQLATGWRRDGLELEALGNETLHIHT